MSIFRSAKPLLGSITASAMLCLALLSTTLATNPAHADEVAPETIQACLKAFGDHPFGANPSYRTLPVKVKVFGIGGDTIDDKVTDSPELVYVRTSVNVAGGSFVQLNNPNGWYCMQPSVNVMGGFVIQLACTAKFVMMGAGATVMGNSDEETVGTTVMGGSQVERACD